MKILIFLNKLKKEGKLRLIEASEEIKKSYLVKSESNLISAKILLKNKRLEESVSLSYYSMYNMLLALLFKVGIKSENHTASIILLKEIFNKDNSFLFFSKRERVDKQYYVDFKISEDEVKDLVRKSEIFNENLFDLISRLSMDDIELYRNKFKGLIS